MLRGFCVAVSLGVFSSVAFASDCATLSREVDTALQAARLSEDVKVKVDMLRARGEEERKAGNDLSCYVAREEALELLNS